MFPSDATSLREFLRVIVHRGLALRPGQPVLATDPYDLHGVHPEAAAALSDALRALLAETAGGELVLLEAEPERLRAVVMNRDWPALVPWLRARARLMQSHLESGGAFLFLTGSAPALLAGLPEDAVAEFRTRAWREFGPLSTRLVAGETQWTCAPAPTAAWADVAYADLTAPDRLPALWSAVLEALHVRPGADAANAWAEQLRELGGARERLEQRRIAGVRYTGPGTDLTIGLPSDHRWCTAVLHSGAGIEFVANLPTAEVFTAPDRESANGVLRCAAPVAYGGQVIRGLELEFRAGKVVAHRADAGGELLARLLGTDEGSRRLGEVAVVPRRPSWAKSGRLFHHALLDENAFPHVALGDSYAFTSGGRHPRALNHSLVHVDLPLDAEVALLDAAD